MRFFLCLYVFCLVFSAPKGASATQSKLRASVEIAVQSPTPEWETPKATFGDAEAQIERAAYRQGFVKQLKKMGFEEFIKEKTLQGHDYGDIYFLEQNFLKDPDTRAIFEVKNDSAKYKRPSEADPRNPVVEITTPPMYETQIERILAPIFQASTRLGWTHTLGGGHLNFDLEEFRSHPTRFVNFLIALHNNPLAEKIFLPVEGEPTIFQRQLQDQFIEAIRTFRALPEKSWKHVLILFKPLFSSKPSSLILNSDGGKLARLEVRPIGNQKEPHSVKLQFRFYQNIWDRLSDDTVDEPIQWNTENYLQNLDHRNIHTEAQSLFEQYGMSVDDYHNWINDYAKVRRRAMERLLFKFQDSKAALAELLDELKELNKYRIDDYSRRYLQERISVISGVDFITTNSISDEFFMSKPPVVFNLNLLNYEIDLETRAEFLSLVMKYTRSGYFRTNSFQGTDLFLFALKTLRHMNWWESRELVYAVERSLISGDSPTIELLMDAIANVPKWPSIGIELLTKAIAAGEHRSPLPGNEALNYRGDWTRESALNTLKIVEEKLQIKPPSEEVLVRNTVMNLAKEKWYRLLPEKSAKKNTSPRPAQNQTLNLPRSYANYLRTRGCEMLLENLKTEETP